VQWPPWNHGWKSRAGCKQSVPRPQDTDFKPGNRHPAILPHRLLAGSPGVDRGSPWPARIELVVEVAKTGKWATVSDHAFG